VLADLNNEKNTIHFHHKTCYGKEKRKFETHTRSSAWIYAIPVEKGDNCLNWSRIFKKLSLTTVYQNNIKKINLNKTIQPNTLKNRKGRLSLRGLR
jgi:hypothetical protein